MTVKDFVEKYYGKKVDYDGAFGCQCIDLFRQYVKECTDLRQTPPVSGAKEIFANHGDFAFCKHNDNVRYQTGDVLIWGGTSKNPYGHVAIFLDYVNTSLMVFEQDGFRQDGAKIALRKTDGLQGCLYTE